MFNWLNTYNKCGDGLIRSRFKINKYFLKTKIRLIAFSDKLIIRVRIGGKTGCTLLSFETGSTFFESNLNLKSNSETGSTLFESN